MAVAAGFTVDVFVQNTKSVDVDGLGRTFVVGPGWLVVAGITAPLVFLIGARVVGAGVARARGRGTALRSAQRAGKERDLLAEQLATERAARDLAQHPTSAPDDGQTPDQEVVAAEEL